MVKIDSFSGDGQDHQHGRRCAQVVPAERR